MYCPECGGYGREGDRFCRACGLNLTMHGQLLTYQRLASTPSGPATPEDERPARRHSRVRRLGALMCAASVACTLLLLLMDALSFAALGLSLTPLVAGIVLLTLTREAPYLSYRPATLPPANREDDAAPELAFGRAGVLPSVTEHTTRSLGGAAPARSPQPARPVDTRPR